VLLLESPRWLLATRQPERARKTLQALAEDSGHGSDDDGSCRHDSLLAGAWRGLPSGRRAPSPKLRCRGGQWDRAGSKPDPPVPAELESVSEGSPQPRYHAVCEIFGTRVIWKNSVILGFAA